MSRNTWDLGADPVALEEAAGKWRALQLLATSSSTTMSGAAREVVDTDWQSDAADAYDDHRRKLTHDVDSVAEIAAETASALEGLAATIRSAQAQLDSLRATLNGIPHVTRADGTVDFDPQTPAQSQQLRDTIIEAEPYHTLVAEELALKEAAFVAAQGELGAVRDQWRPTYVNLVNLNIGSGNDNDWKSEKEGVGKDEIDSLAELLVSEQADIATLQEIFHGDLEDLEHELERRTGDDWEYSFAEADTKFRAGGGGLPWDVDTNAPFGNAVFVRDGDAISVPDDEEGLEVDEHKLDRPGDEFDEDTPDGEGRSAAHAEITFDS